VLTTASKDSTAKEELEYRLIKLRRYRVEEISGLILKELRSLLMDTSRFYL
jgi:hypothetical protein